MQYPYKPKPIEKLRNDYNRRHKDNKNSFIDLQDFLSWYSETEKTCHYCGLKEEESYEIVMAGKLKSNRFPQNGTSGRGQGRGMWLEVDRLKPKENYSRQNCVLCCYFCNNDKSDVFDGVEYKKFMANRVGYLRQLIHK
jgi:hypothetical protein